MILEKGYQLITSLTFIHFRQIMNSNLISTSKSVFLIVLHGVFVLLTYYIFLFLDFSEPNFNIGKLKNFDGGWLFSIVENGFIYDENGQSNIAFFPLFPMIWKFLGVDQISICLINYIFYGSGLVILQKLWRFDNKFLLISLSIPSAIFFYLPYTESLFFLTCALLLYGLDRSTPLAVIGMFLACFSRSASFVFIPIIIITCLFNLDFSAKNFKKLGLLLLACLSSFFLSQYYQYLDTGKYLGTFAVQKFWNREMNVPQLFFTTWDSGRLIWLDGLAFLIGILALYFSLLFLIRKIKNKRGTVRESLLFSIGYLGLITITSTIYTGVDAAGGTTLLSINRYVFATPFFVVFLSYLTKPDLVRMKHVIFFLLFSITIWSCFGFWDEIRNVIPNERSKTSTKLYFVVVTLYSFIYLLISKSKYKQLLWSGLYIFNVILQMGLFNYFIKAVWVG